MKRPVHVLVVEDDATGVLRRIIETCDVPSEVTTVSSAEEGIVLLPTVDAVVTDHRLAGVMTGDQLRAAAEARQVPVLLVSSCDVLSHTGASVVVSKDRRLRPAIREFMRQFQGLRRFRVRVRRALNTKVSAAGSAILMTAILTLVM